MAEFHIASVNITGAWSRMKRAKLYELSKQKRFNDLFLQETHSNEGNAVDWAFEWGGTAFLQLVESFYSFLRPVYQ